MASSLQQSGWVELHQGLSTEGRFISFYVSNPPGGSSFVLDTLILGVFHGDEPESGQLTAAFLERMRPVDLQSVLVGVVPIVNPDGLQAQQRGNARGVDLNRNFPTLDWTEMNVDTPYYSGPSAGSEPETQFILKLLEQYPPQKIVSVHTPYQVINYDGPAGDLAQAMALCNGYPVVSDIGYETPGSFGTYCGKERGIATVTLELPEKDFDGRVLTDNLNALKEAVKFCLS